MTEFWTHYFLNLFYCFLENGITDVSGVMNNILCKQKETVSFKHIPLALSAVDEPTIICIYALPHL